MKAMWAFILMLAPFYVRAADSNVKVDKIRFDAKSNDIVVLLKYSGCEEMDPHVNFFCPEGEEPKTSLFISDNRAQTDKSCSETYEHEFRYGIYEYCAPNKFEVFFNSELLQIVRTGAKALSFDEVVAKCKAVPKIQRPHCFESYGRRMVDMPTKSKTPATDDMGDSASVTEPTHEGAATAAPQPVAKPAVKPTRKPAQKSKSKTVATPKVLLNKQIKTKKNVVAKKSKKTPVKVTKIAPKKSVKPNRIPAKAKPVLMKAVVPKPAVKPQPASVVEESKLVEEMKTDEMETPVEETTTP